MTNSRYERVFITGATGTIGSMLRWGLRDHYPTIRLFDVVPMAPAGEGKEVVVVDLDAMEEDPVGALFQGGPFCTDGFGGNPGDID